MMEDITAFLMQSGETILLLVVVLFIVVLTMLHHVQALRGRIVPRRPLSGFEIMRKALARGAETGQAIHVSPGAGTVGNRATTAETVVGLLAAERVATEAARNGATMLVSSGDAVAHLALRGTLRQAYQGAGQAQDYHPNSVQLLAHQDSAAYAAGVAMLYGRQRLEASQLIGSFNQDFLLIGETGAQRGIPQVAGATSTAALPVMLLSSDTTLIGEEIFAAEAYLSDDAPPQARLRTQDMLRVVVIALIVLGFAYNLLLQPVLAPLLDPLLPFSLPPLPEL